MVDQDIADMVQEPVDSFFFKRGRQMLCSHTVYLSYDHIHTEQGRVEE